MQSYIYQTSFIRLNIKHHKSYAKCCSKHQCIRITIQQRCIDMLICANQVQQCIYTTHNNQYLHQLPFNSSYTLSVVHGFGSLRHIRLHCFTRLYIYRSLSAVYCWLTITQMQPNRLYIWHVTTTTKNN